jgi:hypothetical protein
LNPPDASAPYVGAALGESGDNFGPASAAYAFLSEVSLGSSSSSPIGTPAESAIWTLGANDVLSAEWTNGSTVSPLTTFNDISFGDLDLAGDLNAFHNTWGDTVQPVTFVFEDQTACYCLGTRILTDHGEAKVEDLALGDQVVTASGEARPIRWIGRRRIDLTRHADPMRARPIRIAAGAFPDAMPHRDLLVSPDHAVAFDGMLIPAKLLVNGASIAPDMGCREVTYFHIELDSHDILLAEGLAAESYLDTGNRMMFENGGQPMVLHPDFGTGQEGRVSRSCLPFGDRPDQVEPAWRTLAERAETLGWMLPQPTLTDDPDLHLLIGTQRINPVAVRGQIYTFVVPPGDAPIQLSSRSGRPSEARPWIADDRQLGAMVRRLVHRSGDNIRTVAMDGPALGQGWWAVEWNDGWPGRWTNGAAVLPNLGRGVLEVELSGTMRYPAERPALGGGCATSTVAA